jgi:hypothetical protein
MKNPYRSKLRELGLPYRTILGESSPKTLKSMKKMFLTAICYLLPDDDICPHAKLAGCMGPCLNTAGRGAMTTVQQARARKTQFFRDHRQAFMLSMCADVWALVQKAQRIKMDPLVRPNGTSDIPYENIMIDCYGKTIFQLFPDVQWYDYTKHPSRKLAGKAPENYDLTYSFSALTPKPISIKGLTNPANRRVAVVFHRREDIPSSFRGWPVVDGDDTDVRHIEPDGVVVALYAKGKAKHDTSGFVQRSGTHY